jgi:hypothetical protein
MSRYLDVVNRVARSHANANSAKSANSAGSRMGQISQFAQFSRARGLLTALEVLKSRCPPHIDLADWKRAIADGEVFLSR